MLPPMLAREGQDMPRKTMSDRQAQIVDVAMRIIATQGVRRFTAQLLATEIGITAGRSPRKPRPY
jgi:AcrR family transcriptional regulator